MKNYDLQTLSQKLDELIQHCEQLSSDNQKLLQKEQLWQEERSRLIEKNEVARTRVEAMIEHLKSLKEDE